jgi:hypothetical protein
MSTETKNSSFKSQPKSYINSSGKKVLEYLSPNSIVLDLPFIMTRSNLLTINMPYMKVEKFLADTHVAPIRLLNFEDADGFIYLNVQELLTNKTYTLTWNMELNNDYWLWSLADLPTICDMTK